MTFLPGENEPLSLPARLESHNGSEEAIKARSIDWRMISVGTMKLTGRSLSIIRRFFAREEARRIVASLRTSARIAISLRKSSRS